MSWLPPARDPISADPATSSATQNVTQLSDKIERLEALLTEGQEERRALSREFDGSARTYLSPRRVR